MPAHKMLLIFALLYTIIAAILGLFRLNPYQISGVMLALTVVVACVYGFRSMEPESKDDVLSAGDWLLGTGAALFALTIFSGNVSLWLTIPTGAAILLVMVIYGRYYNRHKMDDVACYGSAAICQLFGPLPIMLAAWAGWWNLAVVGATIVIGLVLGGMSVFNDVDFEPVDYGSC